MCSTACRRGLIGCRKRVDYGGRPSNMRSLKWWMGATHFLTKTLPRVRTELSLHVLAYNLKRLIQMLGVQPLIAASRT